MSEVPRAARHSVAVHASAPPPVGVEPDEVWVPPPFEPVRPGDFIEYSSSTLDVRRSRRGLVLLLSLLLVAAVAGGWWYLRNRPTTTHALTCQGVYEKMPAPLQRYLHVTEGGTLPGGIPMPIGEPGTRCTVSNNTGSGLMVVWPGASQSDYATLLGAGGWTSARVVAGYTLYVNGGDHRDVATTTVDGQLVAMYDR